MVKADNALDLSEPNTANPKQQRFSNRRSLLLLILVFVLPIVIAKLALENQWLKSGVTNHGTLLEQPLTLKELGITDSKLAKQWLIIYRLPDTCSDTCLQSIEAVHNSYVLLGKDMPRVTPVILKMNVFSAEQSKQLGKSQWQVIALTPHMKQQLTKAEVLISDPLGNIILTHQIPASAQQQASFGKAILADMKKLLKYSKAG